MKEFKTAKSKETYERVLKTSIQLFAERGFEKTTMRGISKEAKLGLGALYYYFPSKEAIIIAFYHQIQAELAKQWPEQDPGDEAELSERLSAFLNFKFRMLEPHRPLLRVIIREAVDPESDLSPLSAKSQGALDQSLETFQSMVEAGDKAAIVAKFLWMGHLALIGLWLHRPQRIEKAISAFADLAPFLSFSLASGEAADLIEELLE